MATIKESDGINDKSSFLDREGVFRLSIGIGKSHYQNLFGEVPKRPAKSNIVDLAYDFTATQILMPHPIYAWLAWVCLNNPQDMSLVKQLLDIAYQNVLAKFAKKSTKSL